MKKQIFTLCLSLLSIFAYGQDGRLRLNLSPALPIAGKPMSLTYDAKGSDLEFSDEVSAVALLYRNLQWEVQPLKLNKIKETWSTKLVLPADVAFMTIRFFQGSSDQPEAVDNNDGRGFYSRVLSPKGKPMPGSYFGEVLLCIAAQELRPFATPEKDGARVEVLLKKESQITGGLVPSEDQLSDIQRYYQFTIKDETRAARVKSEIQALFPRGNTTRFLSYQQALQENLEICAS